MTNAHLAGGFFICLLHPEQLWWDHQWKQYKVQLSNNQLLSNGCINFSSKNNAVPHLVRLVIVVVVVAIVVLYVVIGFSTEVVWCLASCRVCIS